MARWCWWWQFMEGLSCWCLSRQTWKCPRAWHAHFPCPEILWGEKIKFRSLLSWWRLSSKEKLHRKLKFHFSKPWFSFLICTAEKAKLERVYSFLPFSVTQVTLQAICLFSMVNPLIEHINPTPPASELGKRKKKKSCSISDTYGKQLMALEVCLGTK